MKYAGLLGYPLGHTLSPLLHGKLCRFMPEPMEYDKLEISSELRNEVDAFCRDRVDAALRIKDKLEKYAAIDAVKEEVVEDVKEEPAAEEVKEDKKAE